MTDPKSSIPWDDDEDAAGRKADDAAPPPEEKTDGTVIFQSSEDIKAPSNSDSVDPNRFAQTEFHPSNSDDTSTQGTPNADARGKTPYTTARRMGQSSFKTRSDSIGDATRGRFGASNAPDEPAKPRFIETVEELFSLAEILDVEPSEWNLALDRADDPDNVDAVLTALSQTPAEWDSSGKAPVLTKYQCEEIRQGRGERLRFEDYVILDAIAEGGMGAVYRARQIRLVSAIHALKTIKSDIIRSDRSDTYTARNLTMRFFDEIRATVALDPLHFPQVHTCGVVHETPYYTLELIDGKSLNDIIEERKKAQEFVPVVDVLKVFVEIADAMNHVHQNNLIHRDLTPRNIMLTKANMPKIIDFGIAKKLGVDSSSAINELDKLTTQNTAVGSPPYMAPEQYSSAAEELCFATDVFVLAATMFQTLTLELPFPGRSIHEMMALKFAPERVKPSDIRKDQQVPPELDALIQRSLATDPKARPKDMAEFRDLLAEILNKLTAPPPPPKWPKIAAGVLAATLLVGVIAIAAFPSVRELVLPQRRELPKTEGQLAAEEVLQISNDSKRGPISAVKEGLEKLKLFDLKTNSKDERLLAEQLVVAATKAYPNLNNREQWDQWTTVLQAVSADPKQADSVRTAMNSRLKTADSLSSLLEVAIQAGADSDFKTAIAERLSFLLDKASEHTELLKLMSAAGNRNDLVNLVKDRLKKLVAAQPGIDQLEVLLKDCGQDPDLKSAIAERARDFRPKENQTLAEKRRFLTFLLPLDPSTSRGAQTDYVAETLNQAKRTKAQPLLSEANDLLEALPQDGGDNKLAELKARRDRYQSAFAFFERVNNPDKAKTILDELKDAAALGEQAAMLAELDLMDADALRATLAKTIDSLLPVKPEDDQKTFDLMAQKAKDLGLFPLCEKLQTQESRALFGDLLNDAAKGNDLGNVEKRLNAAQKDGKLVDLQVKQVKAILFTQKQDLKLAGELFDELAKDDPKVVRQDPFLPFFRETRIDRWQQQINKLKDDNPAPSAFVDALKTLKPVIDAEASDLGGLLPAKNVGDAVIQGQLALTEDNPEQARRILLDEARQAFDGSPKDDPKKREMAANEIASAVDQGIALLVSRLEGLFAQDALPNPPVDTKRMADAIAEVRLWIDAREGGKAGSYLPQPDRKAEEFIADSRDTVRYTAARWHVRHGRFNEAVKEWGDLEYRPEWKDWNFYGVLAHSLEIPANSGAPKFFNDLQPKGEPERSIPEEYASHRYAPLAKALWNMQIEKVETAKELMARLAETVNLFDDYSKLAQPTDQTEASRAFVRLSKFLANQLPDRLKQGGEDAFLRKRRLDSNFEAAAPEEDKLMHKFLEMTNRLVDLMSHLNDPSLAEAKRTVREKLLDSIGEAMYECNKTWFIGRTVEVGGKQINFMTYVTVFSSTKDDLPKSLKEEDRFRIMTEMQRWVNPIENLFAEISLPDYNLGRSTLARYMIMIERDRGNFEKALVWARVAIESGLDFSSDKQTPSFAYRIRTVDSFVSLLADQKFDVAKVTKGVFDIAQRPRLLAGIDMVALKPDDNVKQGLIRDQLDLMNCYWLSIANLSGRIRLTDEEARRVGAKLESQIQTKSGESLWERPILKAMFAKHPGSVKQETIDRIKSLRTVDPKGEVKEFIPYPLSITMNAKSAAEKWGTTLDWKDPPTPPPAK